MNQAKSKVIIIGGHGTALNIAESINDSAKNGYSNIEVIGFANDKNDSIGNFPVICTLSGIGKYFSYDDIKFIFALYKPELMKQRVEIQQNLGIPIHKYMSFLHHTSYISETCNLGLGNIILANSSINSGVRIGNFNVINNNCVIEHDSIMGNNCFLAASSVIGSNVELHDGVFLGLNSTVRENLKLEEYSFLGMGSVLTRNILKGSILYGVPAK